MKLVRIAISLGVALAIAGPAWAQDGNPGGKPAKPAANPSAKKQGVTFWVDDPMKRNLLSFKSSAPLEDIVGTTNEVHGQLVFDPKNPDAGVRGEFRAPVAGLNTGIPLRNEHLRSAAWLDADNHPDIRFVVDGTRDVRLGKRGEGFSTWDMTLSGTLSLHGHDKRIDVVAKVTYLEESKATHARLPGNLLAGRARFTVKLSDYGVKGFKGLIGSRVSDEIDVDVSLMGSTVRSGAPKSDGRGDAEGCAPDEGCGADAEGCAEGCGCAEGDGKTADDPRSGK